MNIKFGWTGVSMSGSYIFFDSETKFEGEVSTDRLVLEGEIKGDVKAPEEIVLKKGSLVQGQISTKKYLIDEGSIHQGKLCMDFRMNGKKSTSDSASSNPAKDNEQAEPAVDKGKQELKSTPYQSINTIRTSSTDTSDENIKLKKVGGANPIKERLW